MANLPPHTRRGARGLGIVATPRERLVEMAKKCHDTGLSVAIHAIGDRGIDLALDAIEEARRQNPRIGIRHRIEHCALCTPRQIERIKSLKAIPSSSIGYMWEVGEAYVENFGPEKAMWLFPHKSYLEEDIVTSGNSD